MPASTSRPIFSSRDVENCSSNGNALARNSGIASCRPTPSCPSISTPYSTRSGASAAISSARDVTMLYASDSNDGKIWTTPLYRDTMMSLPADINCGSCLFRFTANDWTVLATSEMSFGNCFATPTATSAIMFEPASISSLVPPSTIWLTYFVACLAAWLSGFSMDS